jgi:hypothetical protein
MIMFNQKELRYNTNAETWFNETCALMAEDMLAPRIGVLATNNSHAIGMRIPYFNSFYFFYPLTQWSDAYSYSTGFAFGAFLTRNYGGAEFFREMFNNSKLNADCIQAALQAKSGNPSMSFADAVRTFPEAVLFSGTSGTLPSLNKTVNGSGTVAGPPNNTSLNLSGYNFTAVDLYSTDTPPNLKVPLSVRHYFDSNLNTALATKYSKGPLFFGYSDDIEGDVLPIICDIPPTGFTITDLGNGGSGAGTIPTSGSITITTYSNSPIEFYLYKKTSLGAVTKL